MQNFLAIEAITAVARFQRAGFHVFIGTGSRPSDPETCYWISTKTVPLQASERFSWAEAKVALSRVFFNYIPSDIMQYSNDIDISHGVLCK